MLFDSGMGVVSLHDRVPLVTERPLQAVASHTHFDDIGLHHEFSCRRCHGAEAHLTRLLWDGDVVDLGNRRFEVIHTPDQSPGGIALWEAATGILFSGDIVYDGEAIEGTSDLEQAQHVTSMERLLALPARVVHDGHFPSYSGARHREKILDWPKGKWR